MSSRIAHFSSDDVDHLCDGFGNMGRAYKSSRGSNNNQFIHASQNGWDDEDNYELKEEDVWGTTTNCNHLYDEKSRASSAYRSPTENGGSTKGSKGRKSWLTMELQAVHNSERKMEHVGVGFAVLEAAQKGGKESNGGWAPGFSTRKVKILPSMGSGMAGSPYGNGWHKQDVGGKHSGVLQSAPVSISVWPAKCAYGESNGGPDADDSTGEADGDHHEDDDDNDDDDDGRGGRLAPHEIVDREYARSQSTTFSVIEGAGRTLKGMDLRRVRNAVWSCTGFED